MKNKSFKRVCLSVFGTLCVAELISVLAMFLAFSLVGSNVAGLILFGVAASFTVYGMLYGSLWSEGDDDRNKVQFGHMQKDLYRGVKVGFVLMIPYAAVNIAMIIEKLTNSSIGALTLYRLINAHFWPIVNVMTITGQKKPMYYLEAMQLPWHTLWIFVLVMFIIPIICGIAYYLGYKGISLKNSVIYQKKDS